jgi:integrase
VKGYRNLYNRYIAPHVAGVRLFSFRTRDAQALLNRVAAEHILSRMTLTHTKNFLSGAFKFALQMGSVDANPIRDISIPKGKASEETYAYSNAEIDAMLAVLEGTARVAVTVASYTGLSLGELQGLQWQDISDRELKVQRTIWHGIEGQPKTKARKDSIPLLPIVATALEEHRAANPGTVWVFQRPYGGKPLNMANLGTAIKTTLKDNDVQWHGWHALRRGFATRLHEAGVQDRIIQALMRHSSTSVTMKHYVKAMPAANIAAMEKLRR